MQVAILHSLIPTSQIGTIHHEQSEKLVAPTGRWLLHLPGAPSKDRRALDDGGHDNVERYVECFAAIVGWAGEASDDVVRSGDSSFEDNDGDAS